MSEHAFDVVIAGAGIVGLAHAWAASERGLSVAVVERDARAIGASIRNFGFVTVTGQRAGETWRRARRSRDVWEQIAPRAGIAILHRGLWVVARHALSVPVLEAFAATDMGRECELVSPGEAAERAPWLNLREAKAALWSPHELRVESREAIPALARWLEAERGVRFFWRESVLEASSRGVRTPDRRLDAGRVVLCPGTELSGVAAPYLRDFALELTRLQMLRVRPLPAIRLGSAVMSDLSLVRYAGYATLPEAQALRVALEDEEPESLAAGIHLIAVQSADGTLVVGDSHQNDAAPWPFASETIDRWILRHLRDAVAVEDLEVVERWTGVYPVGAGRDCLQLKPEPGLDVVIVTSGTGASTAFAIAEETFADA
ncbi:MAG: TIGR03364 family FAD-dependent oxidoreductase [Burkholderiales bacterium]|nr:TIGR03364 family FAD-dependent oxidoreductase [Burkholderiales bacterium]